VSIPICDEKECGLVLGGNLKPF